MIETWKNICCDQCNHSDPGAGQYSSARLVRKNMPAGWIRKYRKDFCSSKCLHEYEKSAEFLNPYPSTEYLKAAFWRLGYNSQKPFTCSSSIDSYLEIDTEFDKREIWNEGVRMYIKINQPATEE